MSQILLKNNAIVIYIWIHSIYGLIIVLVSNIGKGEEERLVLHDQVAIWWFYRQELMAPNHQATINVDGIVEHMERKIAGSSSLYLHNHYIYRVNQKFREINKYAYTPQMVSIGPFHHRQGGLPAMEKHKFHCLETFLKRNGKNLRNCVEYMSRLPLIDKARNYYAESIRLDNNAFLEMMMLDGLFIIGLFQQYALGINDHQQNEDSLLTNLWSIASLKRDILLLENQLPMYILDELFKITMVDAGPRSSSSIVTQDANNNDGNCTSLTPLCLRFLDCLIMPNPYDGTYNLLKGHHLLDLLGKTLHPLSLTWSAKYPTTSKSVPCVTELIRAGVEFKKGPLTSRLLDIKFVNGILEIPPIVIHDLTEALLRNLIAYEQCSHQRVSYMISYAYFMDSLINSEEDVGILCEKEIMKNTLGNNGEVSNLFNTLCNEATLENFYYSDTCHEVNEYYNRRYHRWIATLNRDYFQNPWTIISFVAAVVLLLLTATQTITSILQVV